jgi:hypothetical protein
MTAAILSASSPGVTISRTPHKVARIFVIKRENYELDFKKRRISKHVSPADIQATAGGKATQSVVPSHGLTANGEWE